MTDGPEPVLDTATGYTKASTDDLLRMASTLLRTASFSADRNGDFLAGWTDSYTEWLARYQVWAARDAEETCHRCGREFINWSAPSPLWNEVMRGGDISGGPEPYLGIICPSCFMKLAEDAGVATGWRLYAATVFRLLQTVTPSGRVWNPETWLFEDTPPTPPIHARTSHGHPCCGQAPVAHPPGGVHRCGGPRRCQTCATQAGAFHTGTPAAQAAVR